MLGDGQDPVSGGRPYEVLITSFGYKNEPPPHANITFDVRFLKNPYWVEKLRPLTGKDMPVKEYVLEQESAKDFLSSLVNMLEKILPSIAADKHERFIIGLGCTGGQHRSVTLVEALAQQLAEVFPNFKISIFHRELDEKYVMHRGQLQRDKQHEQGASPNQNAPVKGTGR